MQWELEALEPAGPWRLVIAAVALYIDRDALTWQIAPYEVDGEPVEDFQEFQQ
ncbi:hypothetical protein AB0P05_41525 [Streptomyces flaveolus]|uniref:hypothetical protein n=1 Tax=Streptomyces flaveolus TaxID=67297 RepID=UPI0034440EB0